MANFDLLAIIDLICLCSRVIIIASNEHYFRPSRSPLMHYALYRTATEKDSRRTGRAVEFARAYVQTSDGIGLSDSYESRENDYKAIGDKKIITPPHALFTCLPIYTGGFNEGFIRRTIRHKMVQHDFLVSIHLVSLWTNSSGRVNTNHSSSSPFLKREKLISLTRKKPKITAEINLTPGCLISRRNK